MLEQVVRPYIPINSFVREPAIVTPTPPKPDIGIRWGKPSKFTYASQGKKPSRRFIFNQPEDEDEDELKEETEIVKLHGAAYKYTTKDEETGSFIQMTETLHFTGRRIVQRYDAQGRRQMPGNLGIDYYFDLTLNEPE